MKYDWLKDYGDNIPEPLEMRADERARVLANALGKVEIIQSTTKRNAGQKRRLLRWAAVLAAVLTLGMLTAGAASGTIEVGELLYWIFGAQTTPEQLDGLALAGTPIGQSQTRDGYTVHLYGAVGDKFSCYLVFDVTAPAGTVLDNGNGYGFQSAELWQTERDSGPFGYYCTDLPDEDPTDGVARFMVAYEQDRAIEGRNYTLRLEGFTAYVDDGSGDGAWGNERLLSHAVWEFSFPMDYTDTSVRIPAGRWVDFRGGKAVLHTIAVSPFSIRMDFRKSVTDLFRKQAGGSEEPPEIVLNFRDGSALRVDALWSGSSSTGFHLFRGWHTSVSVHFDGPVNPEELASVAIDGIEFEAGPSKK